MLEITKFMEFSTDRACGVVSPIRHNNFCKVRPLQTVLNCLIREKNQQNFLHGRRHRLGPINLGPCSEQTVVPNLACTKNNKWQKPCQSCIGLGLHVYLKMHQPQIGEFSCNIEEQPSILVFTLFPYTINFDTKLIFEIK